MHNYIRRGFKQKCAQQIEDMTHIQQASLLHVWLQKAAKCDQIRSFKIKLH